MRAQRAVMKELGIRMLRLPEGSEGSKDSARGKKTCGIRSAGAEESAIIKKSPAPLK